MDPVVLDLPTTALEHWPAETDDVDGAGNIVFNQSVNEWVADGDEGWGETLFLPCTPQSQSSRDFKG